MTHQETDDPTEHASSETDRPGPTVLSPRSGCVLDASALLALLFGEPGAEAVADLIAEGAVVSAVNLSEVATVLVRRQLDVDRILEPLRQQVAVEAFTDADALGAASLHRAGAHLGLSLADRACITLARRLGSNAATADQAWSELDVGVEITMIRAR
jgi:ribonuclease VapC